MKIVIPLVDRLNKPITSSIKNGTIDNRSMKFDTLLTNSRAYLCSNLIEELEFFVNLN